MFYMKQFNVYSFAFVGKISHRLMCNLISSREKSACITLSLVFCGLILYSLSLYSNIEIPHMIDITYNFSYFKCVFVFLSQISIFVSLYLVIFRYLDTEVKKELPLARLKKLLNQSIAALHDIISNPLFWGLTMLYAIFISILLRTSVVTALDIDIKNYFDFFYLGMTLWMPITYIVGISLQLYKKCSSGYNEILDLSIHSKCTNNINIIGLLRLFLIINTSFCTRAVLAEYLGALFWVDILSIFLSLYLVFITLRVLYGKACRIEIYFLFTIVTSLIMAVCSDKLYCDSDSSGSESDSDSSLEDKRKIKKAKLDSTPVSSPRMPNSYNTAAASPMPSPMMPSIGLGFVSENKTTAPASPLSRLEEKNLIRSFTNLSTNSGNANPAPLVEAGPAIRNPTGTEVWNTLFTGAFLTECCKEVMPEFDKGMLTNQIKRATSSIWVNIDNLNQPVGSVHRGGYIAEVLSIFPYSNSPDIEIREPTCRELFVHIAATMEKSSYDYSSKSVEKNDSSYAPVTGELILDKVKKIKLYLESINRHDLTFKDFEDLKDLPIYGEYKSLCKYLNKHADPEFTKYFEDNKDNNAYESLGLMGDIVSDREKNTKFFYGKSLYVKTAILSKYGYHQYSLEYKNARTALNTEVSDYRKSEYLPKNLPNRNSILMNADIMKVFKKG